MRKIYLLILLGLVISHSVDAKKKIEGQICHDADTQKVIMKIPVRISGEPNYSKLQVSVKYFDSNGKKNILYPEYAKEIRFMCNGENIRMLSRNTIDIGAIYATATHNFLKLLIDGKLSLFEIELRQAPAGMYGSYGSSEYVLQRDDSKLVCPSGFDFRNDLLEYFYDCPELKKKIANREFKKKDLFSIVYYYNSSCD